MNKKAVVIGAGFFGLYIANYLAKKGFDCIVLEMLDEAMKRASYNNQARIHAGYHYPRSLMTALRSSVNFGMFCETYPSCVKDDFVKIYAIAKKNSKVSAKQFSNMMKRAGANLEDASKEIKDMFARGACEAIWTTKEKAFDTTILRSEILKECQKNGVQMLFSHNVQSILRRSGKFEVLCDNGHSLDAEFLFNCTYSAIGRICGLLNEPIPNIRHEATEMSLVKLPEKLKSISVTVMCGPFFSIMPFPARGELSTLSHVRYTPHTSWEEDGKNNPYEIMENLGLKSSFQMMKKSASLILPCVEDCEYQDSLWEVKTLLRHSDIDDSRPIYFKKSNNGNFFTVLGGKIDNVFDLREELEYISKNAI